MRQSCFRALALTLCLVASVASAAGTCYQWKYNNALVTVWQSTAQAAAEDYATACSATNTTKSGCMGGAACTPPTNVCSDIVPTITLGTYPAYTLSLFMPRLNSGGAHVDVTFSAGSIANRANPEGCPECPVAGTQLTAAFTSATSSGTSACTAGGCQIVTTSPTRWMIAAGAANYYAGAQTTGNACSQVSSSNGLPTVNSGSDCQRSSDGVTACSDANNNARGCGYYNSDYICASGQTANSCTSTASGGMFCITASGSSTAPAGTPDNGTSGTPATPSVTGTYNTQTWNYYSSTTVSTSTTYDTDSGGTTGAQGGTAGNLAPGGYSDGSGSGTGTDGGTESTCTDDCEFSAAENEEVCTFGTCLNDYYERISEAPLIAAVSGIGASLPSGVCPEGSVSLFGETITLDIQCTLWDDIAPVLSAVFLACWAFAGLRIIMSA